MYRFLIFMLFIATMHGQEKSNTLPLGDWVVVATEVKDGSKTLAPTIEESDYREYKVSKKELCITLDAIHRTTTDASSCVGYNGLKNNIIRTSAANFYTVEKATADTLVLADKDDKETQDKLRRYTMVRRDLLTAKEKEKYNGQATITASKYFSPACDTWFENDLYKAFKRNLREFAIVGKIIFHPKLKTLEAVITASQLQDAEAAATVKKLLDKSYRHWDLKEFAAYDTVELPFVLMSQDNYFYHSIRFHYFTNDIDAVRLKQGGSVFDKGLSKAAFDLGLQAILKADIKEAIELFEYAYQLDPLNIDAIYNKAAMLYKLGDTENACLTWKEIADMGQAEAANMWKTYCNK
jgi:tetratricopeptide (TPR) repeat protein